MSRADLLAEVVDAAQLTRATRHETECRLSWSTALEPGLQARVDGEQERFDAVAEWRRTELVPELPGPWTRSPRLVPAEVERLLSRHPGLEDVRGLTVLDVGGTLPVSWRFLAAGARAVHHVDISVTSQQVGFERCRLHGVADERLFLHTVPVEALPFRDASFDLVFSRNSVHHVARPRAYDELARVLRPGGHLLVFEPWLNRVARRAVFLRRRVLRVDRGTDDPLGRHDLVQLRERFSSVELGLFGAGATPLIWALGRIRPLHPMLRRVQALEARVGGSPVLARALATHGWVLARR